MTSDNNGASGEKRCDLLRTGVAGPLLGTAAAAGAAPRSGQPGNPVAGAATAGGGSRIDPARVQLLFVDLQTALVARSTTAPPAVIAQAAGVLAKVGKILRLPMTFSVVMEGKARPTAIPELVPFSTPANTLLRGPAGALTDLTTANALAGHQRPILFIAGFTAEVAVLHAVLDAIAACYTVHYVVDCIGSQSARTEAACFREMEQAGAVSGSVLSLTTRMTPDFSSPPGSETFAALQPLLQP